MQRYSEQIPWVSVHLSRWNDLAPEEYQVKCEVCGASGLGTAEQVAQFAQMHANHQGNAGSLRLGDAVAAVAKPIAKAFGRKPCTPCEARRRALNNAFPNPWRR